MAEPEELTGPELAELAALVEASPRNRTRELGRKAIAVLFDRATRSPEAAGEGLMALRFNADGSAKNWSAAEQDAVVEAYGRARVKHGHIESLFAVVCAWVKFQAALPAPPVEGETR